MGVCAKGQDSRLRFRGNRVLMIENASVQAERKRQDENWWTGVLKGYHSIQRSEVWFTKTLYQMTTEERGEILGVLLKENETHYK